MKKKRGFPFLAVCMIAVLLFSLSVYGQAEETHKHGMAIRTEQAFLEMQDGGTYYLENNITVSESVTVSGEISLCLNGKVLKYQNTEKSGSIFRIKSSGILNIFDCSEETHTCEVKENGLWILSDDISEDGKKDNMKTVIGGLIIGGTGETREIEELGASYRCGGFAYAEGGKIRIYGGNIVGNTAGFGGAVYLAEEANLEIYGGKFCGNLSDYRGGAVFSQGGSVLMNDGIISENRANKNGGGVNISGTGTLEMNGGRITGNKAEALGGGVENFGTFVMNGGTIGGNTASKDGGGVYNEGTFTMRGGTVLDNTAKYGAGVCNDKTFIFHDGNILSNLAQESGGGIYNADTVEMRGGKIAGNTAKTSGGGIENDGTFLMYDGIIGGTETNDANAAYLGGGVCVYSGIFTMYGGKIEKNTGIDGGGVENEASFIMAGGVITQNFASMQGGGITNRGKLILKGSASIIGNGSGIHEGEHKGGGIYWIVDEKNSVSAEGAVTVTNNTTNGENANLVIHGNGRISVSALSDGAYIGFTLLNKNKDETAGAVIQYTDGENIENFRSCFSSDDPFYIIKARKNEIRLSEKNIGLAVGLLVALLIVIVTVSAIIIFVFRRKNKEFNY